MKSIIKVNDTVFTMYKKENGNFEVENHDNNKTFSSSDEWACAKFIMTNGGIPETEYEKQHTSFIKFHNTEDYRITLGINYHYKNISDAEKYMSIDKIN